MDGQGTKPRRKIAENFNRLSRAHQRHRQTTDSKAIANGEPERKFTFANKLLMQQKLPASKGFAPRPSDQGLGTAPRPSTPSANAGYNPPPKKPIGCLDNHKNWHDDSGFDRTPVTDRQTDRQTQRWTNRGTHGTAVSYHIPLYSIASRGQNLPLRGPWTIAHALTSSAVLSCPLLNAIKHINSTVIEITEFVEISLNVFYFINYFLLYLWMSIQ